MTNYNDRLDEMLRSISTPSDWISDEAYTLSIGDTKQAITSLIKELVVEAKPEHIDNSVLPYGDTKYNQAIDQFEQNLLKELEEV